jgi:hypothetical protein
MIVKRTFFRQRHALRHPVCPVAPSFPWCSSQPSQERCPTPTTIYRWLQNPRETPIVYAYAHLRISDLQAVANPFSESAHKQREDDGCDNTTHTHLRVVGNSVLQVDDISRLYLPTEAVARGLQNPIALNIRHRQKP